MLVDGLIYLFSEVKIEVLIPLVIILVLKLRQMWVKSLSLPPGPLGLPIVGSWPSLKGDLHLFYKDLSLKYGPIFSARFGSQLVIVLSSYQCIREAFNKGVFTGRPSTEFTKILQGYGVINTEGKLWKDQRRFIHDRLRHFGMSYIGTKKVQMERRIMREVESLLCHLKTQKNEPVDLNHLFQVSISNVICDIIMSIRFSHNDSRFKRMMTLIEEGFQLFGTLSPVLFFPVLKYLPRLLTTRRKIFDNRQEMGLFLQETIDAHKQTFEPENVRDLLDAYLLEIYKAEQTGNGHNLFEGKDHDLQIQQIMGDLFSAGMETIKSTLLWGFIYMLRNPESMKAVQDELDAVVGRQRLPKLEDMPYLPITEATIFEILRVSSVVPMGTTHSTTRDVEFKGFRFPQDAQIVPLLHAVHNDPELWDEPEKFNPSRFINAEGKVTKPEYFMPFGVGRRTCLGEVLAKMELFLFFSSLLHSFDLYTPEGEELPSLQGFSGVTITPNPYKISLKARPMSCSGSTTIRSAGSH